MPNLFKDSSAPYVLTIIVAALSWLLNSAIEEVKSLNVVHYTIERDGSPNRLRIEISNLTNAVPLTEGKFVFACREVGADCFPTNRDVRNYTATLYPSGVKSLQSEISVGANGSMLIAPAALMPQSTVQYFMDVTGPKSEITLLFDATGMSADANAHKIVFRTGFSVERFVLQNYFTIIVWTIAVVFAVLVLWIVSSLPGLLKRAPEAGKKEVIHVKIVED